MSKFLFLLPLIYLNFACENEKGNSPSSEKNEAAFVSFENLPDQLLFSITPESHEDNIINTLTKKEFIFDPIENAYIFTSPESNVHVYPIFLNNKIHQLVIAFHFENEQQKAEHLNRIMNEISVNADRKSQNQPIHEFLFLNDHSPHLRVLIEEKSLEFRVRMKLIQKI